MEGSIWVIIFVLAILFRAFRKFSDVKGNLPRDWEGEQLPPILREMVFPWDLTEDSEEASPGPITGKAPEERIPGLDETPAAETGPGITLGETLDQALVRAVNQEQNVPGELLPLFDSYNIINGIIVAELLHPPKCRQRRIK
ncbi:MAG: hypothetical protein CVV03_01245 [Firmicutes bacterium HGW-Firmicutes-8]|nr:MAG: hypothetical protein CVV03_01245 [Firmicutes bacterium HGW-Firmicutes-8]